MKKAYEMLSIAAIFIAVFLAMSLAQSPTGMLLGQNQKTPVLTQQQSAAPELKTVTLGINGMMCHGCATFVKNIIEKLDGVKSANVSYEEKKATVIFEPSKASVDQIISAINASSSYTAELIE